MTPWEIEAAVYERTKQKEDAYVQELLEEVKRTMEYGDIDRQWVSVRWSKHRSINRMLAEQLAALLRNEGWFTKLFDNQEILSGLPVVQVLWSTTPFKWKMSEAQKSIVKGIFLGTIGYILARVLLTGSL